MDASAPGLDTMMYREPGDIWIFKVATLNRITNPDHVHAETSALAELHLVPKPGAFQNCSWELRSLKSPREISPWANAHRGVRSMDMLEPG